MPPITSRTRVGRVGPLLGGAICAVLLGACAKEFEHKELGPDSRRAEKAMAAVNALRSTGSGGVERFLTEHGAGGLTTGQQAGLYATVKRIATADEVALSDLDRFGEDIYRASFQLVRGGSTSKQHVLLVKRGGALKWAGPN